MFNVGDMGSVPGPRRYHMLWSIKACAPQLPKPLCLGLVLGNKRSHGDEKPVPSSEEEPLLMATRESLLTATGTQHSQKERKKFMYLKRSLANACISVSKIMQLHVHYSVSGKGWADFAPQVESSGGCQWGVIQEYMVPYGCGCWR